MLLNTPEKRPYMPLQDTIVATMTDSVSDIDAEAIRAFSRIVSNYRRMEVIQLRNSERTDAE